MVDVQTEIIIYKPLQQVYSYAVDPDNAPVWYVNIKTAEWVTSRPLVVGSQIAFKAAFLGKQLSYVYEIKELLPEQKLVMQTADGPFPMETTYEWEAIDNNSTKMKLRNRGKPSGFSKLFAPFMKMMMRKAIEQDLKNIRRIIEKQV